MLKNGCITVGNTEMCYAAFGGGAKKLVVLPGLSDGLATVKNKAAALAPPYRKFFRDFTVYMFSRKNDMPESYGMADMAEDQALAMRELGIDKACLLGVSQGGMIAQLLAARHPELIDRLILAVTAPYANDLVKTAVSGWIEMAKRGDHTALMVDTAEKMYSDGYLQKNGRLFPLLAKLTKPSDYDRFLKNAEAILRFDARGELSKILCPTLIIAGGEDKTVGKEAARELKSGIAGSELTIYEKLGHGAYEEAKDFYDRVLAFCER